MIRLLSGDCRDVLPTLPAESVQCVVCSPPYYGLRDYQTGTWDGGDAGCDHKPPPREVLPPATVRNATFRNNATTYLHQDSPGRVCRCGAVRVDRQIGLEPTPDEYLATMVGVFRQIRRVLRSDGTVWCNLGDSYAGASIKGDARPAAFTANGTSVRGADRNGMGAIVGLKPKDLLLMPARLALALQADGWWVRSDIIWHKPNPMPESVTDRPTSAHEHVFLLTRSARYFYDAAAIAEPADSFGRQHTTGIQPPKVLALQEDGTHGRGGDLSINYERSTRACRNVWTLATHPYAQAHFATFPPELAERCIRAGTSERGCCAACGKPWRRVTETAFVKLADRRPSRKALQDGANMSDINSHNVMGYNDVTTTGWSPGCQCGTTETRPCVVLDPFAGAGTTLLCSDRLQRDCIGIELNTAYTEMAMERCRADAPLFTSFPPAEPPEDERMADLFTDMAAD